MKLQVKKEHYDFSNYVSLKRWISFYYQILEILKCKGKRVLLIGVGDGSVVSILKNFGKEVTTLDIDDNLKPDIVGSIVDIDKLVKEKYDIIVCCQVLEHIPFENFEKIISKISKITIEKFILSLPNHCYWMEFSFRVPILDKKTLLIPIYFFWERKFDINKQGFGEHYWEINAEKQYKKKRIEELLKKYYNLDYFYKIKEHPYHMFFILSPKNNDK